MQTSMWQINTMNESDNCTSEHVSSNSNLYLLHVIQQYNDPIGVINSMIDVIHHRIWLGTWSTSEWCIWWISVDCQSSIVEEDIHCYLGSFTGSTKSLHSDSNFSFTMVFCENFFHVQWELSIQSMTNFFS